MDDLVGKGAAAKHNNLGAIPRMHRVEPPFKVPSDLCSCAVVVYTQ